jgi:hypothetical protein
LRLKRNWLEGGSGGNSGKDQKDLDSKGGKRISKGTFNLEEEGRTIVRKPFAELDNDDGKCANGHFVRNAPERGHFFFGRELYVLTVDFDICRLTVCNVCLIVLGNRGMFLIDRVCSR